MKLIVFLFYYILLIGFSGCIESKKKQSINIKNCDDIQVLSSQIKKFQREKKNQHYFSHLKQVKVFNKTKNLSLSTDSKALFRIKKNGLFNLEILFHFWEEKKEQAYMVQYSFIEDKTKNLVFENAQTLYVSPCDK